MACAATNAAPQLRPERAVLLYDAACPLCVNLAALVKRRAGGALLLSAWQEFVASPAGAALSPAEQALPVDQLRLWQGGELRDGAAAWTYLLHHYPDLHSLSWLAERTGLTPSVARAVAASADLLRRLCRRCPRPRR